MLTLRTELEQRDSKCLDACWNLARSLRSSCAEAGRNYLRLRKSSEDVRFVPVAAAIVTAGPRRSRSARSSESGRTRQGPARARKRHQVPGKTTGYGRTGHIRCFGPLIRVSVECLPDVERVVDPPLNMDGRRDRREIRVRGGESASVSAQARWSSGPRRSSIARSTASALRRLAKRDDPLTSRGSGQEGAEQVGPRFDDLGGLWYGFPRPARSRSATAVGDPQAPICVSLTSGNPAKNENIACSVVRSRACEPDDAPRVRPA